MNRSSVVIYLFKQRVVSELHVTGVERRRLAVLAHDGRKLLERRLRFHVKLLLLQYLLDDLLLVVEASLQILDVKFE